jgi:hypothetical protein
MHFLSTATSAEKYLKSRVAKGAEKHTEAEEDGSKAAAHSASSPPTAAAAAQEDGRKAAVISAGGLRTVAQAASGGGGCCRHAGQLGSCLVTLKLPETSRSALKLLEADWISSWRRKLLQICRSTWKLPVNPEAASQP